MVPQDLHFVHNAKTLTFIGQKKIKAMPVEAAEEKVWVVSVDRQQNRRYEDARGTKTRHGV
jgi:hypothetical protein